MDGDKDQTALISLLFNDYSHTMTKYTHIIRLTDHPADGIYVSDHCEAITKKASQISPSC